MTQEMFLANLNLTAEEFRNDVSNFSCSQKLLSPLQRIAERRSQPTMARALEFLSPEITPNELLTAVRNYGGIFGDIFGDIFGSNIVAAKRHPGRDKKES